MWANVIQTFHIQGTFQLFQSFCFLRARVAVATEHHKGSPVTTCGKILQEQAEISLSPEEHCETLRSRKGVCVVVLTTK